MLLPILKTRYKMKSLTQNKLQLPWLQSIVTTYSYVALNVRRLEILVSFLFFSLALYGVERSQDINIPLNLVLNDDFISTEVWLVEQAADVPLDITES